MTMTTSVPENPVEKESHPFWNRSLRAARPEIVEGFSMPGFAGNYYMWPEEYSLLAKYVDLTQGDYLEIGSMCGIIAASLAEKYPTRTFVCVDKFEAGHATIAGNKGIFLRNVANHHLNNVKLIEGDSKEVVPTLSQPFGIAFIDANHAYDYVLADAFNCWKLVAPGGFLAFHDYECVEQTTRALHDFVSQTNACIVEVASSLAVVCKPSVPVPQYRLVENEVVCENALLKMQVAEFEAKLQALEAGRNENSLLNKRIRELEAKVQELEVKLQTIENSKGWRLLNRYRDMKNLIRRH